MKLSRLNPAGTFGTISKKHFNVVFLFGWFPEIWIQRRGITQKNSKHGEILNQETF
jgi:hypothetical protein